MRLIHNGQGEHDEEIPEKRDQAGDENAFMVVAFIFSFTRVKVPA